MSTDVPENAITAAGRAEGTDLVTNLANPTDPATIDQVARWRHRLRKMTADEKDFQIVSQAGARNAANAAKEAGQLQKEIDTARLDSTAPLRAMTKKINDLAKPLVDGFLAVKTKYASKVAKWDAAERKRQEEEAAKLQAQADQELEDAISAEEAGDDVSAESALDRAADLATEGRATEKAASTHKTRTGFSTVTERGSWKAELVDASKVPREYLTVDMVKVRSQRFKKPKPPEIPGIKWTFETTAGVR